MFINFVPFCKNIHLQHFNTNLSLQSFIIVLLELIYVCRLLHVYLILSFNPQEEVHWCQIWRLPWQLIEPLLPLCTRRNFIPKRINCICKNVQVLHSA